MKKIVTIQDISCFGKCSLTVALPVISSMGIETAVIPTAILSTHTSSAFGNFTFRDLTADINGIAAHWKELDLKFDAIYTGYLGSVEQADIVSGFFDSFSTESNFIVVDPVLGDGGSLYSGFTDDMVRKMRELCKKADYILPNMTEAAFLLDIPYTENYTEDDVRNILLRLADMGCKSPILTGVHYDGRKQGAAGYDTETGEFFSFFSEHIDHIVHGTGDIFSSVFTGAVTLGKSVKEAVELAVWYVYECIKATLPVIDEVWYSSCFELCIGKLCDRLRGVDNSGKQ